MRGFLLSVAIGLTILFIFFLGLVSACAYVLPTTPATAAVAADKPRPHRCRAAVIRPIPGVTPPSVFCPPNYYRLPLIGGPRITAGLLRVR